MAFDSAFLTVRNTPEILENMSIGTWATLAFVSVFVYAIFMVFTATYRLYFHPLASFPGVRAACLSEKWSYDQSKGGFPEKTFEKLHKQFGTKALRIGPNELHISDVQQYKNIYSQRAPFLKFAPFYDGFNTPHTLFAETDPTMHRDRRHLLNQMFSRTGVFKLEPVIHAKLDILTAKIHRLSKKTPINVYDAFRCMTTEIIQEFAFARSAGLMEESQDSFKAKFLTGFDVASKSILEMQYRPNLRRISSLIPRAAVKKLNPAVGEILDIVDYAESSLRHFQKNGNTTSHPVVFENLTELPDKYQVTEAMDVLIAGADTTASTLTTGLLNILANRDIEQKLVEALRGLVPSNSNNLSLLELEKIDYLTGCVKESLRLGMAVPGRLPRVVPGGDAVPFIVDGKRVPPGTVIGMSTYTMHTSEELWGPDALSFVPERWIGANAKALDQYLCTFSKGARMCIGQNVALAEITLAMGNLFTKFKLSLPENAETPDMEDAFTLQYAGRGLDVYFTPL